MSMKILISILVLVAPAHAALAGRGNFSRKPSLIPLISRDEAL
jgi:hypothetical protein